MWALAAEHHDFPEASQDPGSLFKEISFCPFLLQLQKVVGILQYTRPVLLTSHPKINSLYPRGGRACEIFAIITDSAV